MMGVAVFAALAFAVLGGLSGRRPGERPMTDIGAVEVAESLDVLMLATDTGLDVAGSLELLIRYGPVPVQRRLEESVATLWAGRPVQSVLAEVRVSQAEPFGLLLGVLEAAHRDGVPILARLEVLAVDLRRLARSREQAVARRLSVRLLIPLVIFMLPAFAMLTVVPVVVETLTFR